MERTRLIFVIVVLLIGLALIVPNAFKLHSAPTAIYWMIAGLPFLGLVAVMVVSMVKE